MAEYSKFEHAWRLYQNSQDLMRYADRKVQIVLALSLALLSFGGANMNAIAAKGNPFTLLLVILYYVSTACFGYFGLLALFARSNKISVQNTPKLVFFGHIIQYEDSTEYVKSFEKASSADMLKDLCHQNYQLSIIANKKFKYYRLSWRFLFAEIVFFLSAMVVSLLVAL